MPVEPVPYQKKGRTSTRLAHRTDITLPPTVADAIKKHAEKLEVSNGEYHRLAIAAFFKHCLVNPPEPFERVCHACGRKRMAVRSGHRRVRIGVRFDIVTVDFLESLAADYFGGNWSRVFEEAMRHFLGDENPPPEGWGRVPGEKQPRGRNTNTVRREKRIERIHALQQKVKLAVRDAKNTDAQNEDTKPKKGKKEKTR